MFTLLFWKAAAERAISTFAQTAVAMALVVDMANWSSLDFIEIVKVALIGGGLSILKSVAAAGISDGSPSIGNVESLQSKD